MPKVSPKLRAFNLQYSSLIIVIYLIIIAVNFFNLGRPGFNRDVVMVYLLGAIASLILTVVFSGFGVFNWINVKSTGEELPIQAGHISESSQNLIFSNNVFTKFIPHIVWTIIIVFTSLTGLQVWRSPDFYSTSLEFSQAGASETLATATQGLFPTLWNLGINPGFVEDMISFGMSIAFVAIILLWRWLMLNITKNPIFKLNKIWYTFSYILGSGLAALSFSKAHEIVAGQNTSFFIIAWIFQTFNLIVMWSTGLFLPLAHIIHNSMFALGFAVAFSIALAIVPIMRIINKREVKTWQR